MKTLCKRLFALLLALGMALSLCAAPVWAAGPEAGEAALSTQDAWWKGTCGENAKWDTDWADDDQTCTMTISGTGAVGNFWDENGNEIIFKDRVTGVDVGSGITSIGYYAFEDFPSLEQVVLPGSVEEIKGQAFYGCEKLREVSLSDGLERIGNLAFGACISLESIAIPGSVQTIEGSAFESCTSLSSVSLEEGLEYIGEAAFNNCALMAVTIPKSVKEIEPGALGISNYTSKYEEEPYKLRPVPGFTISGYTGSVAEIYALSYGINFESIGKVSKPAKTSFTSVKAKNGKKIEVKWKKVTDAQGYELQYSTDKKFKKGVKSLKIHRDYTKKTVSKLKAGKTYYFRIRTFKGSLTSGWSAVKSAKAQK